MRKPKLSDKVFVFRHDPLPGKSGLKKKYKRKYLYLTKRNIRNGELVAKFLRINIKTFENVRHNVNSPVSRIIDFLNHQQCRFFSSIVAVSYKDGDDVYGIHYIVAYDGDNKREIKNKKSKQTCNVLINYTVNHNFRKIKTFHQYCKKPSVDPILLAIKLNQTTLQDISSTLYQQSDTETVLEERNDNVRRMRHTDDQNKKPPPTNVPSNNGSTDFGKHDRGTSSKHTLPTEATSTVRENSRHAHSKHNGGVHSPLVTTFGTNADTREKSQDHSDETHLETTFDLKSQSVDANVTLPEKSQHVNMAPICILARKLSQHNGTVKPTQAAPIQTTRISTTVTRALPTEPGNVFVQRLSSSTSNSDHKPATQPPAAYNFLTNFDSTPSATTNQNSVVSTDNHCEAANGDVSKSDTIETGNKVNSVETLKTLKSIPPAPKSPIHDSTTPKLIQLNGNDHQDSNASKSPQLKKKDLRVQSVIPPQPKPPSPVPQPTQQKPKDVKTYNVIILGASGAGKSSLLNNFYFIQHFQDFEKAKNQWHDPDLKCLLPGSFDIIRNGEVVIINFGETDNTNENLKGVGQSVTQRPMDYLIDYGDFKVKFVDTPGLGDTRGFQQDEFNIEYIQNHLLTLSDIHGIMFVVKNNETKLSMEFENALDSLFGLLPRAALKNCSFVYTFTSTNSFLPGSAQKALSTYVENFNRKHNLSDLELGDKNQFCVDNDAIRELFVYRNGHCQLSELSSYKKSWDGSKRGIEEFLERVRSSQPLSNHELTLTAKLRQLSKHIRTHVIRDTSLEVRRLMASVANGPMNGVSIHCGKKKGDAAPLGKDEWIPAAKHFEEKFPEIADVMNDIGHFLMNN